MISEEYGHFRGLYSGSSKTARESSGTIPESVLQCIWYDQLVRGDELETDDGRGIRVLFPGWWNRSGGPDFKGAHIEFNGRLMTGDVEVHVAHGHWNQHGHHLDSRYDDVLLEVVFGWTGAGGFSLTSDGRRVPRLCIERFLSEDIRDLADQVSVEDYPHAARASFGACAAFTETEGTDQIRRLLNLAGEWRLLAKARAMRERMERVGVNQAIYEAFLSACGFSRYKHHFRALAQQLHYDRIRQLALQEPLLAEAAFLQLAGLLPDSLPKGTTAVPHFARIRSLRRDRLGGLKCLPLVWKRDGVRPNNYPERRLAGAARMIARTAHAGLEETLAGIWAADITPIERRRAFEELSPAPMGFWADHCTWTGTKLSKPVAMIGQERVRSIIGNVFVPAALALARQRRDRAAEEKVLQLFVALPKEVDNVILKHMLPRVFGHAPKPRLDFRSQQGLLQLYHDWCQHNPSCIDCTVLAILGNRRAVG